MSVLSLAVLVPGAAFGGSWLAHRLSRRAFAAAHRKARRQQAALANFPHQQDRRAT